jgi:AraC-like DNA-binding protein
MQKWFSEVFWSEQGCGEFKLKNKWVQISGPGLFHLLPGEIHDIRARSNRWTYHWFTLDHPQSASLLKAFGLNDRPIAMHGCPVQLFQRMFQLIREGNTNADREAANCAHMLLVEALRKRKTPGASTSPSWLEACRQRIDRDYSNAQLNVSALVEELGIHRTTLFRAFLQSYQMTPSHYLQSRRLQSAMDLLKQTDLPVKTVAQRVGFSDSNYLARLLRKVSGLSPIQFRLMHKEKRMDSY